MRLEPRDLHLVFAPAGNVLKVFDAKGGQLFACAAHNRTVRDGQYSHWGNAPPGLYRLARPVSKGTAPFGPWFVGLEDFGEHRSFADHGRSGIGIHGGGSGLGQPLAPHQSPPWVPTHGCLRLLNVDLIELVHLVKGAQGQGGVCYIDVLSLPKFPAAAPDDYLPIEEDQLDPDE